MADRARAELEAKARALEIDPAEKTSPALRRAIAAAERNGAGRGRPPEPDLDDEPGDAEPELEEPELKEPESDEVETETDSEPALDEDTEPLLEHAAERSEGDARDWSAPDAGSAADSRPIVFVTLREFLELDFPPAESLIGHVRDGTNLLPRFGWAMPWGREGSTKTTLLVDLLFHAAAGRQWLHYPIPRPLRIVAIVNEGVPGGFQDKLDEKRELWDGGEGPLDGLAVYASPWGEFTFRSERMLSHLRDFARDFGADYVVGDPLHTLGPSGSGTPEETEEFKHLLRDFGLWEWIGIITAHHSNKTGMVSGDWARHPDTVLHLEKDGRLPRTKLTVQKARPADPAELSVPQLLEWVVETKSYRLVETDPEKAGDANRERVLSAVRDGLRSANDVGERTGLSARTVKRHFRDLEKAETITLSEGPNRTLLASLGAENGDEDEGELTLQEELEWN